MTRTKFAILALFVLLTGRVAAEETPNAALLTLDRIFSNANEFDAESFGPVRWLKKNGGYTTKESSDSVKGFHDIVRHDPESGRKEVVVSALHLTPPGESSGLKIEDYSWSPNEALVLIFTNSKRVWRHNTRGDYWVFDLTSRALSKLGGDGKPASLMFAKFSPDGRKVSYVRDRNIFVEDLTTHSIVQLTKADSETIINGTFDWVYEEEFGLRDGVRWSPDSSMIAYWQLDTKGVGDYYLLDDIDGLYQRLTKYKYPKVGTQNSSCRIGLIAVDGSSQTKWIEPSGDLRNHYVARMDWIPNSDRIVYQHLNRLQNKNEVVTTGFHPKYEVPFRLHTETDKAWVDVHDNLEWIDTPKEVILPGHDGAKELLWLSESSGWRNVYGLSDGKIRRITSGDYDVIDIVGVAEKAGWLYYLASPDNATQKYLYRAKLDGSKEERVTPTSYAGTNTYNLSPDGKWAIHTHSAIDSPPVTQLVSLPEHKTIRTLAANEKLHARMKALKRTPTEFLRVPIGDGVELDGWRMKPPDFDPAKKYPLLFYAYGEPAAQTVLDDWGGQRYLWHLLLAQQGYVVMSVDNRGTPAPRGREWRKFIYRHMGELAPQDQAAAARAILKNSPYIDAKRVGIWGWSGGGTMTLHAIFRFPDLYRTGISVAPVTNERFYDTIYSERYMGLPLDNVKGYRDGSAITYANQLKGNLLIIHGTGDDNVHYANTEVLVNELIARNKQFDMLAYPNRSHAIREGENTRRHLFTSMTRYLQTHLQGP